MFKDYGTLTLSVFLNYFSNDANTKNREAPDYNKQDNRKRTILHKAATTGHVGVVKGLLSIESINPNQLEKDQCTPLGLALRDDKDEIAHILLEKDKVDVNAGNGSFGAPLHIAVSRSKVDIVNKLIKKHVDVNKLDFKKQTPLHIIMDVFSRDTKLSEEITRILVFNGAKPNLLDSEKLSPLHRSVIKRHSEGVQLITQLNKELGNRNKETFDLNLVGGEKKYTPIYYALEKKAGDIAELLFIRGAKVCIRLNGEYLPREWKKRESNNRRHLLWKMERFELEVKTHKVKYMEEDLNHPKVVKRTEGNNNCLDGYTTVGSYIKKFYNRKQKLLKKKGEFRRMANRKNSCQKILFTINNPKLKEGDIEVDDVNVDSDIDIEERESSHSLDRNSHTEYKKKNMNELNNNQALKIPKSLSVNNTNH